MDGQPSPWRNLRHWTLHVVLSAAASFAFAYHGGYNTAQAVVGMTGGVFVFIVLYTRIWSSRWFRERVPMASLTNRALLYGTRLRSTFGIFGFGAVLLDHRPNPLSHVLFCFFVPDLYAGAFAAKFVDTLGRSGPVRSLRIMIAGDNPEIRARHPLVGDLNSLFPTFLITITEGILLTLMLLALSWLCRLFLSIRAYWKSGGRQEAYADPDTLT